MKPGLKLRRDELVRKRDAGAGRCAGARGGMPEHGQEMQMALTHHKTTVVQRAMGICEDASKSSCPTYQPNILTSDQAGSPGPGAREASKCGDDASDHRAGAQRDVPAG